jgi:predicted GIY-YIG superfamily endonuclease
LKLFRRRGHVRGSVYLLHFSRPYKGTRHYIGFSTKVADRLRAHKSGRGSPFLKAVHGAGIRWTVARRWHGVTGDFESKLKSRHNARGFCPKCS